MFKKILVANRGEIALRVIRACKELGILSVAVHSDVDRNSLHVKMADESVCIGPADSRQSYLSIPKILSAAEITNADAIHPGYGFLAENSEFANVCQKCNITFIGPKPEQIELMGNKIQARQAMKKLDIPMLDSIEVDFEQPELAIEQAKDLKMPLIIKAASGGGGKGIKIVYEASQLWQLIRNAQSEAQAAFGDSKLYIEKYLDKARHIEFQIAGDKSGRVICIGERECSIQRRYQKLIEEAPASIITEDIRKKMGKRITHALESFGYESLGTVEFLMDSKQNFYFLEMNTRIQVEHPVTEEVTGIDLVKLQIRIAAGEKIPYKSEDLKINGHAIEMRINAEDSEKFFPSSGRITALHIPGGPGIRMDYGVYDGFFVSPYYDSLLGKLIITAPTRSEAITRAKAALSEFVLEGIQTNIPLHQRILSSADFIENNIHTKFIDNLLK